MKTTLPLLALICLLSKLTNAQTWEPVSVGGIPANYYFSSISVVDENVVWLVANVFNHGTPVNADHLVKVLKTTDGGQTWQAYEVEEAMGRISYDITAIDLNTAWISSNRLEATDTRPLFKTTDGGETWEQVELSNMAGGVFVHFFDAEHGLAIRNIRVAITDDGGENWTEVPAQNWPLGSSESLIIVGKSAGNHNAYLGNHAWVGTNAGKVLHSTDYGWTWTAAQVGTTTETINSIAFTDTLHGVAAITTGAGGIYPATKLMETFDGGVTWTQGNPAPTQLASKLASVPGAPNTFVVGNNVSGFPNINTIAYNQNGITDSTWVYNTGEVIFTQALEFTSPANGFAAGFFSDGTNVILKWNGDLSPVSTVGTIPLQNSTIRAFPSPFKEQFNVQLNFEKPLSGVLEVYDFKGSQLFSETFSNKMAWSEAISTADWPTGLYILKCRTAAGVTTQKVLKQ